MWRSAVALGLGVGLGLLLYRSRRKRQALHATEASRAAGKACMLVHPTMSDSFALEYSIHRPSRLMRREIELVFKPDLEAAYQRDPRGAAAGIDKDAYLEAYLLALPTWQPSKSDLSEISFTVNQERRGLLLNFDVWARAVRARLGQFWSDCSCPMEGTARYGTTTSTIYNELEGLTQLLRYDSIPIGCCGIVLHPQWQRRAYPVTFFTIAPIDELTSVLAAVEADHAADVACGKATRGPIPSDPSGDDGKDGGDGGDDQICG
jgi:hypothetical protein